MRRLSIWDVIISVAALAVVCSAIIPAVARLQRTPEDARCQSNMRRIGFAIQQYTEDWNGRYPTNRMGPSFMILTPIVNLSPYDATNPQRFVYGLNWVESLYDYLEPATKPDAPNCAWRCPLSTAERYPVASTTASVTYALNYNLLEQPTAFSRNRSKLMLMREMDRLVTAICRPMNKSRYDSSVMPMSPFLTTADYMIRGVTINRNLHTQGSHILFADGHVTYFSTEYFPEQMTAVGQCDQETKQWWNWLNTNSTLDRTIAITP